MEDSWKRSQDDPEVEVNLTLKKVRYHLSHRHLAECRQGGQVKVCIYVGAREGRLEFGGVVKQVRLLDLVTEAMGFDGRYRTINSLGSHWDPKNMVAYKSWAPANSRPVRVTLPDGQVTEAKSVLEATQILMRWGENISPKRLRELFKAQSSVTLESGATLFCYSA